MLKEFNLKDGVTLNLNIEYPRSNVKESLSIDTTFNLP
jgi:hypothetical protein